MSISYGKNDRPLTASGMEKVEKFSSYCDRFGLVHPHFADPVGDDGSHYTSPELVLLNEDADVEHVFGHWLCDYHNIEPEIVADVVKSLLLGK